MKKRLVQSGFTLLELLVVIALIAILATALLASVTDGYKSSRDTERKGDLRTLETALERYRLKHGRYPAGCNDPTPGNWPSSGNNYGRWSGQLGTDYECADGTAEYIRGHASGLNFAPEFISSLPIDPKLNGSDSGYVYTVDEKGEVYKLMALNTVESETVSQTDEFTRCGRVNNAIYECTLVPNAAFGTGGNTPNQCNSGYQNDYAIRAGFSSGDIRDTDREREYFSDQIRCK